MRKKVFFIILSVLCVAAAVILVLVGIRRTTQPAVIEGLESLGELTLEAYDAVPDESGEEGQYTIFYRYIDPKYGEIVFSPSVDRNDYESFLFDKNAAELDPENAHKTTVRRYVYVYPKDGRYESVFQDTYMSLYEVSELIEPSEKASSTYYFIMCGILLLGGAYLLFLAFVGKRSEAADE